MADLEHLVASIIVIWEGKNGIITHLFLLDCENPFLSMVIGLFRGIKSDCTDDVMRNRTFVNVEE